MCHIVVNAKFCIPEGDSLGKKILVYLAFEKTCPATSLWKGAWMSWINYERTLEIAWGGELVWDYDPI